MGLRPTVDSTPQATPAASVRACSASLGSRPTNTGATPDAVPAGTSCSAATAQPGVQVTRADWRKPQNSSVGTIQSSSTLVTPMARPL